MEPFTNLPQPPPPPTGASSAQKALAALALMLGVLGIVGGCWGIVGNLLSGAIMDWQGETLGAQGMPGAEGQLAFAEASRAILAKWGIYVIVLQVFNVVASSLLVAAGVQVWRVSTNAPVLALIACGSNVVVDAGVMLVNMAQQMEIQEATRLLLPATGNATTDATMQSFMKLSAMLGSCFMVGWLLVKLSTYISFAVVMRRRP